MLPVFTEASLCYLIGICLNYDVDNYNDSIHASNIQLIICSLCVL